MASKLKGNVIVITGVSSGLGLAMTEWFHSQGYTVVGCSRSSDKIKDLQKKFGTNMNGVPFCTVDIANDSEVKAWADTVIASFGPPKLLLNNAGAMNERANLWSVPVEEFDKIVDVNIKGTANVIRHFVPRMIAAGQGIVVNFTSGWGRSVSPHVAPYCASKYALEGLSKALAMELPPPLACIPLNPGIINTPLLHTCFGPSAEMYPGPYEWVQSAGPYILSLNRDHNGQSLEPP